MLAALGTAAFAVPVRGDVADCLFPRLTASAVVLVYRAIGLGSLAMALEPPYDVLFEHHSETGTSGGLLKRQDVP